VRREVLDALGRSSRLMTTQFLNEAQLRDLKEPEPRRGRADYSDEQSHTARHKHVDPIDVIIPSVTQLMHRKRANQKEAETQKSNDDTWNLLNEKQSIERKQKK
jgi:hypothetical protein